MRISFLALSWAYFRETNYMYMRLIRMQLYSVQFKANDFVQCEDFNVHVAPTAKSLIRRWTVTIQG